jgi:hypothetical protein
MRGRRPRGRGRRRCRSSTCTHSSRTSVSTLVGANACQPVRHRADLIRALEAALTARSMASNAVTGSSEPLSLRGLRCERRGASRIARRAASRLRVVSPAARDLGSPMRTTAGSRRRFDRDVGVVATAPAFTSRSGAPRTVPCARNVVESAGAGSQRASRSWRSRSGVRERQSSWHSTHTTSRSSSSTHSVRS